MACSRSGYIDTFACRLADGAWLADVGLPTIVTLLGLGLAYFFLRKQLRHDLALRRADRLDDAATEFGLEIQRVSGQILFSGPGYPWWQEDGWAPWGEVDYACRRLVALTNGSVQAQEFIIAARILDAVWSGAAQQRQTVPIEDEPHAIALRLTSFELAEAAYRDASELMAWDGLGRAPEPRLLQGLGVTPCAKPDDLTAQYLATYVTNTGPEEARLQGGLD